MTAIPKIDLTTVSPRFKSALAKEVQLAAHLAKIDAGIAGINASLNSLAHSIDNRAEAMLSAEDLDSVAAGGEAVLRDELARLEGDRRTALRAIDMARKETGQARGEASADVCKDLLPEYRKRVSALAEALLVAHRAHAEMTSLTDSLDAAGVSWTGQLRPVPIKFLRQVDRSDAMPSWFLECRQYRLIDIAMPEHWVREWSKAPPAEQPTSCDEGMSVIRFFKRR